MSEPLREAEDAVARAIAEAAGEAAPEDLKKLAEGVGAMKFGAQGGSKTTDDRTDYHYTPHEGDRRSRPAGFGGG